MVTFSPSEVLMSGNVACSAAFIFTVVYCFLENLCIASMCEVNKIENSLMLLPLSEKF